MARTVKVRLDDTDYEVPALNIKQLQLMGEATTKAAASGVVGAVGLDILMIALERATPKPDIDSFAPQLPEVGEALTKILELSGLKKPEVPPPA